MSIYATLLEFSQEDGEAIITNDEGQVAIVTDEESIPSRTSPYTYTGSHKTAHPDLRSGSFSLAETAPWCSEQPFLRISVSDDNEKSCALLFDFEQVQQIAEVLHTWIQDVESGKWRERRNQDTEDAPLFENYLPTS